MARLLRYATHTGAITGVAIEERGKKGGDEMN